MYQLGIVNHGVWVTLTEVISPLHVYSGRHSHEHRKEEVSKGEEHTEDV